MPYDHTKDVVEFALLETLAYLRAIHWSHWTAHWQVSGDYGDHLLFEKLYQNVQEEIDSLAEKCVSFFGVSSVNEKDQAKKMMAILGWVEEEDVLKRAMTFEDKFIGYLVATWELVNGANKMTMGLDSLLQSISETHENHLYLLRQRTKTNKLASKVASAYIGTSIVSRVADQYLKQAGILDKLKDMFFTNKDTGNKVKFNSLPKDQRDEIKKKYEEDKEKDKNMPYPTDNFSKILSQVIYDNHRKYKTLRNEDKVQYDNLSEVSDAHLADAVFHAYLRSSDRMENMQDYLTRTLETQKKKNLSDEDYRILGFELLKMDEMVRFEIRHYKEKWVPTVKELTKRNKKQGERLQAHLDGEIADMKSVVSEKYRKEKYDEKTLKSYEERLEEEKVRQKKIEDDYKEIERKEKERKKKKEEERKKEKEKEKNTKKDTKKKSSLRSSLIRVAYENPSLRKDLLPLVRTKVAKSPRKKWENPNNGRSKVVFTEAILDNPKKLLDWWETNVGELLSDTSKTAHHMTIEYGGNNPGVPLERVEQLGVGSPVRLEIIGYAQSDRVQAVLVKPQGVSSTNRYPHITVAVGNGGNPSESNDLLARGYERVKGETLTAKIGYFGKGKHLTHIDWESE